MRTLSVCRYITILSVMIGLCPISVSAANYPMSRIYQVAQKGNAKALRALRLLNQDQLNITDANGNTALCQAILKNDYPAFNVLKQAGANTKAKCVQQIPPQQIQTFTTNYADWARAMGGVAGTTGLSTPALVGIGVGAAALIGGGIAIAASSGGGGHHSHTSGGSSDGGSSGGNRYITPDATEQAAGNFINQIKANKAHEKGYTGYRVNDDGSTGSKVKVGILDNGTDINHPDLAANIVKNAAGQKYGYNFDYGPCRNGDTTHCYGFKAQPGMYFSDGTAAGDIVFYKTGANDYEMVHRGSATDGYASQATIDSIFSGYAANYDWDTRKNDPTSHLISVTDTAVSGTTNVSSADHGTHVAGIVAATQNNNGMYGVAPNAQIVAGVYDPSGLGYGLKTAMETYASEGVRVVNMSFGQKTTSSSGTVNTSVGKSASEILQPKAIEAYQVAARNNIVTVKAAGNEGNNYAASIDNGIPLTEEFKKGSAYDLTNLFITVVSATKGYTLSSYSQTCGAAQGYCLTAPGGDAAYKRSEAYAYAQGKVQSGEWTSEQGNKYLVQYQLGNMIYSTAQTDAKHVKDSSGAAYGYMNGTSQAAPVVTGSVALLMGAFPHLTSQQVVEILFRTANKNLVGWTDDGTWTYTDSAGTAHTLRTSSIFGHGMVDLDKATQPLGTLTVPTGNTTTGPSLTFEDSNLTIPRAIFRGSSSPIVGGIVVLDDYQRGFTVPATTMIKRVHHNSETFKRSFRSFMARPHKTVGSDDKLSFSFSDRSVTEDSLMGMGSVDMRLKLSDRQSVVFQYRSDVLGEHNHFEQSLANPFLDMRESYGLTHTFQMNKILAFSFGAQMGKNGFLEGDEDRDEDFNRSVQSFTSEVAWRPTKKMTLRAVGGVLHEKDALLGMNGTGAFKTENSQTYFTGAVVEYNPTDPITLSAAYYYGRSEMPKAGSLVSFSNVISDSFALDAKYRFDEQKMLGLSFSSPLRIRRGTARFDLPIARDLYTDTVYREQIDASLKPNAREYDLGLYYTHETDNYDWRGELMARFHPDHVADAKTDYRALLGLSLKY